MNSVKNLKSLLYLECRIIIKKIKIMKNLEEKFEEFVSTKENPQDYYIEDGLVCCYGEVLITDEDLIDCKLPFRFGEVDGDFICFFCHSLTSLEGCPKKVGGSFICWG